MNTGSLTIIKEDLGLSFSQYYTLGKELTLSRETMHFLRKWDLSRQFKCESCGRYFSPRLHAPKINNKRCIICRKTWRREYKRNNDRLRLGINPQSFRKPFEIFKPTGSYIV